jgi:hypothetical protein
MLTHHESADYNVSASQAAKEARSKFEAEIERGKTRALAVIEQVERQVPVDRVVKNSALNFRVDMGKLKVEFKSGKAHVLQGFHRNALAQAAERAGMPLVYIDKLMEKGAWGRELVAENLNELYHNGEPQQFLTRSVNEEVRGFLSNAYRRMDSRPILEAFVSAATRLGALPVDGYALDTKIALKAVLPYIFEPVPHEVMLFGMMFETSDFGNGKLCIRSFVDRLWCTNRAIGSDDLAKVHVGARLTEDMELSRQTYELDTRTMASLVNDVAKKSLGPGSVNHYLEGIKQANEQKIEGRAISDFLRKHKLTKFEEDAVTKAFNSADVEMLPAGQTTWRMSNAISWIANTQVADEERKLELMKIAGTAVDFKGAAK